MVTAVVRGKNKINKNNSHPLLITSFPLFALYLGYGFCPRTYCTLACSHAR
jgi:hypothetical protein